MIIHGLEWCLECILFAVQWILWSICKWLLINAVLLIVVLAAKRIWTLRTPNRAGAKQPKKRENKQENKATNTPDTHTHEAAGLSPNKRTGTGELTT